MKRETIAIIDLGSNTTRLDIYETDKSGRPRLIAESKQRVRLSENMGEGRLVIGPDAIRRALSAMTEFAAIIKENKADRVIAVATEAMRVARNGAALCELIRQTTEIPIQIISGDEEAHLDYLAVRNSLPNTDYLMIDTGGGSCELVLVRGSEAMQLTSLRIGSVVLSERFTDRGDMSPAALFRLYNFVHARLAEVGFLPEARGLPIVALGGNHRALFRIWMNTAGVDAPLHGYSFTRDSLYQVYADLLDANLDRRQAMLGKNRERADIITAGVTPLVLLARVLDSQSITISEQGLREGVFHADRMGLTVGRTACADGAEG